MSSSVRPIEPAGAPVDVRRAREHELAQVDRNRHVVDVDRFGARAALCTADSTLISSGVVMIGPTGPAILTASRSRPHTGIPPPAWPPP